MALGRVAEFLSRSENIIALIRGGTVEGSSGGSSSVIALSNFYSVFRSNGSLFVVISNKMIPKAHISTYVVGSLPLTTSGAMYTLVVSLARVSL